MTTRAEEKNSNTPALIRAVVDALKIPENVLTENARQVSRTCSSEIIDSEYYKRINDLAVYEN